MRITIDVSEDTLKQVMTLTGETHKSPAVAKALETFVKRMHARKFGRLIREGSFDYPAPAGEL